MKVLLVTPSFHKRIRANYPVDIDGAVGLYPPLGLFYLASALESGGEHTVDVLDMHMLGLEPADIPQVLEEKQPDLLGMSLQTFNLIDGLESIRFARQANASMPIVAGGPHAHIYPKETLAQPGVDYVITGEGEWPLTQLVDALAHNKDLNDIPGLWRNDGNMVVHNAPSVVQSLDTLPFPDRRKTPADKYTSLMGIGQYNTIIMSSRGCPYKCVYCDRPQMGKNYRAHSAKYMLEEVKQAMSIGIDGFAFFDDTLTVDKERIKTFCQEVIDEKLEFSWSARTRVNLIDDELLQLMSRAGCHHVSFGIESGRQHVLDALHKGIKLEQVGKAVQSAKRAGLTVYGDFMFGNPSESLEDMQATIDFACSLPIDYAQFSITTPYPATPMYDDFIRLHPELGDYWREYAANPDTSFVAPVWAQFDIPPEELVRVWKKAIRSFYFRPRRMFQELARGGGIRKIAMKAYLAAKVTLQKA